MRDITGNMLQAASMHEKAACLRPSEPTLVILSHSSKPVGQLSGAQFCQEPSPLLLPLPLGTVGPHCSLPFKTDTMAEAAKETRAQSLLRSIQAQGTRNAGVLLSS